MNDLISRKALLEEIKENHWGWFSREMLLSMLENQPSVTYTNLDKWIPCSERLPKSENKYGWVECNVTVMRSHFPTSSYDSCDAPYDEYFVAGAMYDTSQKIWHLGEHTQLNALIDIEDSPLNGDCVIAWMPLPPVYEVD